MGKIPRVSGNQLIKYLVNKKGFQVSHRKGSHVSLHKSTHKFTPVPSTTPAAPSITLAPSTTLAPSITLAQSTTNVAQP
ncbi:MAG: hypothetical protein QXY22_05510 [Candidatus Nitrosotenuis sp.]